MNDYIITLYLHNNANLDTVHIFYLNDGYEWYQVGSANRNKRLRTINE
jgi:hypothetical protein